MLDLARHEVALCDLELLLLGVAGELDHLHAVAQWRRDRLELVGRGDEEDVREVERQVEVVVAEGRVLLGIEHLEHRARRVAAEVGAHLVDLVDHQDRVVRARVAQRAHDRAGHRADVGAPVPADLRLVPHTADRDALEVAAHRRRDGLAERGLAHAGGTDEAEDRAAGVGLELAHREELEDPVLHLLHVVVVAVERLARLLEVEVVLRRLRPRQRDDPLEVGADDPVLGRLRGKALEATQLALGLLAGMLGKVRLLDLLAQVRRLGLLLVHLAELFLDGLELLAKEELALPSLHLGLDLRLDLAADRDQLQLAREHLREAAQPLAEADLREQLLALLRLDAAQRARDQVSQLGGILQVRRRDLQLLGEVGNRLHDLGERALHVAEEALELGRGRHLVRRLLDARHEVGLPLDVLRDPDALCAVDEDPQRAVGHLHHPGDRARHAHVVEVLRPRVLDLAVARGHHHQHPVAGEHVVHELDRALLTHRERGERVREGNAVLQRQHRQRLGQPVLDAHVLGLAVALGISIIPPPPPGSARGARSARGEASGTSTVRMPSS